MWAALVAAILLAPALNPPAPPPSRIVFASPRTGVAQLYSVEPSGEGLAQLTFGAGNWGFPVPSPDGQFVAAFRGPELWVDYPGELVPAPRPELWLMRADGSGAQLVSRDAAGVSWSSDSRRLVFGSAGSIWTVAVPGGQPERLTSGYYDTLPSVSPDGRSIAFVRANQPGVWQVVARRNGHERIVGEGLAASPAWSPNGKWIAIHGLDTVDVVRPTGGVVQAFSAVPRLCSVPCPPPVMAWSPDSSRLAFETQDGIELAAPPAAGATLLVKGLTQGLAWSPGGDAVAFAVPDGVRVATLDGHIGDLASFGPGGLQWGIGWSPGWPSLLYQTPEDAALVRVSGRELEARFPIRQLSADGDRVAYWLCPHTFEAWRPGDAPVVLGPGTVAACLIPVLDWGPESNVYDLTLAGDRLAYLTQSGVNTWTWQLWLTTLERGDEGVAISSGSQTSGNAPRWAELEDLVGGGSALVYGQRGVSPYAFHPEEVWRVDGATPVQVASRSDDYQPLAVDGGRIVARWIDGSLDLLSLDGHVLEAFDVPSLGAALAGDDLVVLVQSELRDYSVSSGELLHAWPLPDVPSSGRCRLYSCPGIRLTLDDTARGLVVYTLDRVVHLLRLSDGADATVPGATAAEITDDGLFYAYLGEDPWPGRIRFVPFDELPLP
jgi:Tol biopolymer transport system component